MKSSGTFQSDIKIKVLELDNEPYSRLVKDWPSDEFISELTNLRDALLDFLICGIDPKKCEADSLSIDKVADLVHTKYLKVMGELMMII